MNVLKKLVISGVVIIALFAVIAFLSNQSAEKKSEGNPYGKDKLHAETIALLNDENYQHITTPKKLQKDIETGETTIAYFFHPTCQYCQQMTPELMKVMNDVNVPHFGQLNLMEFEEGKNQYALEGWPTLMVFEDGQEVDRIAGYHDASQIENFLTPYIQ